MLRLPIRQEKWVVAPGFWPAPVEPVMALTATSFFSSPILAAGNRAIVNKWAPPNENNSKAYVENVSRLTDIHPDEPLGIPSESPARWIALGAAIAIQENGITSIDWFAILRGWEMARNAIP